MAFNMKYSKGDPAFPFRTSIKPPNEKSPSDSKMKTRGLTKTITNSPEYKKSRESIPQPTPNPLGKE
tara:strand:+ start:610 stop:810 length:201 start_codon:yes stop_codon:yes gene_type:complete